MLNGQKKNLKWWFLNSFSVFCISLKLSFISVIIFLNFRFLKIKLSFLGNKINFQNESLKLKTEKTEKLIVNTVKSFLDARVNKQLLKLIKSNVDAFKEYCCLFENSVKNEVEIEDDLKTFIPILVNVRYEEYKNLIHTLNLIDHILQIIETRRHEFGT